ncbi:zinc ribbon domain-containing protein [Catenulispora sp. NF23]|uniref:zinc ribbon domain-containing protein n=1 Tax=Catenulispora pinistramenti TaxID=2705254 RepID=UPI001BA647A7|nr:zinc ribbon domain-containing protein [Catenulispora pinistramenti]MBS2536970.1 zinc ribbon domain-containing protein [Catenulispora pinistramenti]
MELFVNRPDTAHTYALRTHTVCALCEHAMFGKSRHGVPYYYCCNPSRHLRPGRPSPTLYIREDAILDGVNRFFLARVFGEERESLLYALTNHQAVSAASDQERRAKDLEAAIQDVDKRRSRQVRALELSDNDEGFIREIRCHVAELGTEQARLVASLETLNAERPPTMDPTLIRALPMSQINLAELDHELRFKLFRMFRLEVRFNKLSNRAHCTITLTPEALPALQSELAAAGFAVPPECMYPKSEKAQIGIIPHLCPS